MNTRRIAIVDRFLKLNIVPAICLVLCGLAPTVPAKAQTYESFKTPTGNIICIMNDTDVECGIKSGLNPAPPKQACTDGDPVFNRSTCRPPASPSRCDAPEIPGRLRRAECESARLWRRADQG